MILFIYMLIIRTRQNINCKLTNVKVIKHFNDSEAFIVYSNDMDDIYRNIEEHNPGKKNENIDCI